MNTPVAERSTDYSYVDPVLQQSQIEALVKGVKPADEALKPYGQAETKSRMIETGVVPVGAFAHAELFSDVEMGAEQNTFRRQTTVAAAMVDIMGNEDNPALRDPEKRLRMLLTSLTVQANRDRAVMVEAATQYYQMQQAGTLTPKYAEFLRTQLDTAQNRMYPMIDKDLAQVSLDRILGQNPNREPSMSTKTREAWYQYLHQEYDPIFASVYEQFDEDTEINGQRLVDMTNVFMRESGLPMTDEIEDKSKWKCVYSPDETGFRVLPAEKKIVCGNREKSLTKIGFEKLMMHEVIIHAWRAENGSRTGFDVAQTGMPGYLETEEGLGILMESLWTGEDPEALSRDHYRYVAVAFANGDLDGIKHTEQETYDFIRPLMERNGIGDNTNELFFHVMRVFRGMPEGCRMRSNASYLSGKNQGMKLLESQYNAGIPIEEQFTTLRACKNNPCDSEQVALAEQMTALAAKKVA